MQRLQRFYTILPPAAAGAEAGAFQACSSAAGGDGASSERANSAPFGTICTMGIHRREPWVRGGGQGQGYETTQTT